MNKLSTTSLSFVCSLFYMGSAYAQDVSAYLLAMSWSPTYCQTNESERQCDPAADHALILHGLWPQHDEGRVSYCTTPNPKPSRNQVDAMLDITPAPGLVRHQWRKHGACSGLSSEDYFDAAREAFEAFKLPRSLTHDGAQVTPYALQRAVYKANADLPDDSIQFVCRKNTLREIRVCYDANMQPEACDRPSRTCERSPMITLPASP